MSRVNVDILGKNRYDGMRVGGYYGIFAFIGLLFMFSFAGSCVTLDI